MFIEEKEKYLLNKKELFEIKRFLKMYILNN